jgi:hypothetical protein
MTELLGCLIGGYRSGAVYDRRSEEILVGYASSVPAVDIRLIDSQRYSIRAGGPIMNTSIRGSYGNGEVPTWGNEPCL